MSAFDDLTLGEVDDIERECLAGQSFTDADPLKLAGAVMWATTRKNEPGLTWEDFRYRTRMSDIREFSEREMSNGDGKAGESPGEESPKVES